MYLCNRSASVHIKVEYGKKIKVRVNSSSLKCMDICGTSRSFQKIFIRTENSINVHNKWRQLGLTNPTMAYAVVGSLKKITRRFKKPVRETGTKGQKSELQTIDLKKQKLMEELKKKICCFHSGKENEVHEVEREIYSQGIC